MTHPEKSPNRERCWTIEVCRTCHRLARWPFCEHREDNGSWYRLATVKEVGR